jgi:hypothetical protein
MNNEHVGRLENENKELQAKLGRLQDKYESLRREYESSRAIGIEWSSRAALRHFDRAAQAAGLPDLFSQVEEELRRMTIEDLFDRWTQRNGPPDGSETVTVIPGSSDDPVCNPLVIVFVRPVVFRLSGRGGPSSSANAIEALKLHLETCRIVKGVLLVFEWAAASEFDESLRHWIKAWKKRGIAFALGGCGPDGSSIQPFPIGI